MPYRRRPFTRLNVGSRVPVVGRRAAEPSFADLVRPWIAYEAWERVHPRGGRQQPIKPGSLQEQIVSDLTIRPPLRWQGEATQPASAKDRACLLVRTSMFYKRHIMAFRRVASALLPHDGGTRPGAEYRIPVIQRIAGALSRHYRVRQMPGTGYRTPLRILFETAHAGLRQLRPGEMAMMFLMLTEAAGIPCALLVDQDSLRVVCKVNPSDGTNPRDLMVFDPETGSISAWGSVPMVDPYIFELDEAFSPRDQFNQPFDGVLPASHYILAKTCIDRLQGVPVVPGVMGEVPPVLQDVMWGRGLVAAPEWQTPRTTLVGPDWYHRLVQAMDTFDPNEMHAPFLMRPSQMAQGPGTWTAENFGPMITGGIIAFMARLYSRIYTDIFRDLVQWVWTTAPNQPWFSALPANVRAYHRKKGNAPVEDIIFDFTGNGPSMLGWVFGEWVRRALPYCEETIAVEEITGPLAALRLIAHYPGIQKFDCDDVSVFWMTCMESVIVSATQLVHNRGGNAPVVMTAVRLAGDAPSPQDPDPDKYHVYPLLAVNGFNQNVVTFDVSNPLDVPLNDELEHGGNAETRWPQVPATWLGMFYDDVELETPEMGVAAGRYYQAVPLAPVRRFW